MEQRLRVLIQNHQRLKFQTLLIYGLPGTGKTSLVHRVSKVLNAKIHMFDRLASPELQVCIEHLRNIVKSSKGEGNLEIVMIDNCEDWFFKGSSKMDILAVFQLIQQIRAQSSIFLVMVTSDISRLHPLVKSAMEDQFECEIPSVDERFSAWKTLLTQAGFPFDDHETEMKNANSLCNGWVYSDIAFLCAQVHIRSTFTDLHNAIVKHEPYLFRHEKVPWTVIPRNAITTNWNSIGGLDAVKESLKELVLWPAMYHELFKHLHVRPPSGVLLYGPPGTGKTLLACAVSRESQSNFMSVSISDIVRGYVGESEKAIATVFRVARRMIPCVLFFDEFQALFGTRDNAGETSRKMISQLLLELDNVPEGLILMASTNVPEAIDQALLRPGRFDRIIHVPLPDEIARKRILDSMMQEQGTWGTDVDTAQLASKTPGRSGAELFALCQRAILYAASLGDRSITQAHLNHVIQLNIL